MSKLRLMIVNSLHHGDIRRGGCADELEDLIVQAAGVIAWVLLSPWLSALQQVAWHDPAFGLPGYSWNPAG